jgi:hypothetical protein
MRPVAERDGGDTAVSPVGGLMLAVPLFRGSKVARGRQPVRSKRCSGQRVAWRREVGGEAQPRPRVAGERGWRGGAMEVGGGELAEARGEPLGEGEVGEGRRAKVDTRERRSTEGVACYP